MWPIESSRSDHCELCLEDLVIIETQLLAITLHPSDTVVLLQWIIEKCFLFFQGIIPIRINCRAADPSEAFRPCSTARIDDIYTGDKVLHHDVARIRITALDTTNICCSME